MTDFTPAAKIDDNVESITTSSAELNRILGGGFQIINFQLIMHIIFNPFTLSFNIK
jgi:hypothetical protein